MILKIVDGDLYNMSENLRVGVAQFPASNDIQENKQYILQLVQKALAQGVDWFYLRHQCVLSPQNCPCFVS